MAKWGRLPATRGQILGALALLCALPLALASGTWVRASVQAPNEITRLSVSGLTIAPIMWAVALVAGAALAAAALAGRIMGRIAGIAAFALCALVAVQALVTIHNPAGRVLEQMRQASGVTTVGGHAQVTVFTWGALVVGIICAGCAVVLIQKSGQEANGGRRFIRRASGVGSPGTNAARGSLGQAARRREQAMDDWDDLSRGIDPSQ